MEKMFYSMDEMNFDEKIKQFTNITSMVKTISRVLDHDRFFLLSSP